MDHEHLVALARTQHGLVTRDQILSAGGTEQRLRTLLSSGAWQRARRGIYVIGAAPATWERKVMGACLAAGEGAVASHRSAARLWALVSRSGQVQLTVADDRRVRLAGIELHRSALLPRLDRTRVDGIPTTTVARTVSDLSSSQDETTIGGWVDEALRAGSLELLELQSCVARLAGPGRTSMATVRAVLAMRLPGYDPGDSNLEVRAMTILHRAGLPTPVQQHRVVRPDGRLAFIDLAYPEPRVGIELDGWAHHGRRGAFDEDRERRNDLTLLGWRIYNFTATTTDGSLASTIRAALATLPTQQLGVSTR